MPPELIRLLHVVSSALMFGVGVGAFWFMVTTVRSGNPAAIAVTTRNAVRAEWFIAAPVAVIQPTTGYLLMLQLGHPLQSMWFYAVAALYIVAGMCWVMTTGTWPSAGPISPSTVLRACGPPVEAPIARMRGWAAE